MNPIKSIVYRINQFPYNQAQITIKELAILEFLENRARLSGNPLTNSFSKCFSQADEDIIISKILNRIENYSKNFLEFGPGDGLENNTISLLAKGWNGMWIGAQNLQVNTTDNSKLVFLKQWVDLESIERIIPQINDLNPFLVSMDLDGNDYYVMEYLLQNNVHPGIIVQEYNGSIPADIEWVQSYSPDHSWSGTNYYGASLLSYIKLFESYGYTFLCCNLTGVNSFFIKNEFNKFFLDIPRDLDLNFVYPLGFPYKDQSLQNKEVIQEIINKLT
jgi:hypothetical protein